MDTESRRLVNRSTTAPISGAGRKNWVNWWAQVATAAERRGSKRVDRACVAELYPGYLECLESEPDYLGRMEEFGHLTVVSPVNPDFIGPWFYDADGDDSPQQIVRSALRIAHETILRLIPRHDPIPGSPSDEHRPRLARLPRLRGELLIGVRDGKIMLGGSESRFADRHLVALVQLLQPGRPFLFARCPRCGRIFARSGRGLRCSTYCTNRVAEANRRKTDKRRKQARESMRKLRAKRAQEQKATLAEGGND